MRNFREDYSNYIWKESLSLINNNDINALANAPYYPTNEIKDIIDELEYMLIKKN